MSMQQKQTQGGHAAQQAITGLVGMMGALLLETWLFIIRSNFEPHPALKKRPIPPQPPARPARSAASSTVPAALEEAGVSSEAKKTQ